MADIDEQLPSLPVGLFMADPDGRITAANEAFGALVHGPLGSVLGGPPWADAHPGDRASAELAWRRGVEAGGDISLSFRVWHGEGRMLWVRIDAAPRRDLDNRLVGFSGTALDSTDAVAGEQLLDRLAAVALLDTGRFAGTLVSYRAGHTQDVRMAGLLYLNDLLVPHG